MKYIIFDNGLFDAPVIFDEAMDHGQIAEALAGASNAAISAGFVIFTENGLQCFGRSHSLDLDSRPIEDSKLINKMLGLEY